MSSFLITFTDYEAYQNFRQSLVKSDTSKNDFGCLPDRSKDDFDNGIILRFGNGEFEGQCRNTQSGQNYYKEHHSKLQMLTQEQANEALTLLGVKKMEPKAHAIVYKACLEENQ